MQKYNRNSYVFHEMNNDAAYWLGFLYTDGSVGKDGYIQLRLNDYEAVEQFKNFIQYEGEIQTVIQNINNKTYTSYQINFQDDIMSDRLIKLGCIPQKTYKLKFPTNRQLSKKFYRSFIRGVFDGDGSVFWSGNKMIFDITGTEDFLIGIRDILVDNKIISNKRSYIYNTHAKSDVIKRISISKKESVRKFYDYIYSYNSGYCLKRKKDKYEELMDRAGI